MELLLVESKLVPTPTISGLIRPSSVGPQAEKSEISTSVAFSGMDEINSMAPTVRIFLAFPVVEMMSYPSFLALEIFEESFVEFFKK